MDADALNILAEGRVAATAEGSGWLITPHPGEAGRLLGVSAAAVQADRFAAVEALQHRFKGTVVLKGAGSLVASPGGYLALCPYGNPGMASGGMGDVLSGILGGFLAQGYGLREAANLGVCVHSLAADDAVRDAGQRGLRATDLRAPLRKRLNGGGPRRC